MAMVCSVSKITPELMEVLLRREREHADALARGDRATVALSEAPIEVRVALEGSAESLAAQGFPLHGFVPGAARGGLSPAQIRRLATLENVLQIDLPTVVGLQLDRSVPEIRGKEAWTVEVPPDTDARGKGEGVIVGVVDSGIDVFHGAFRNPDGSSRILRLWDQTFRYDPVTGVPVDTTGTPITGDLQPRDETGAVLTQARAPTDLRTPAEVAAGSALFNYGGQFDTAQINAALAAHPDGKNLPISLMDQPVNDGQHIVHHGTHVAGIAAGNGAQNDRCTDPFTYVGVAPKADLVIVKTSVGAVPNREQNLEDAAQYIFRVASRQSPQPSGKPCVINFSLGGHFGPHNGHADTSRSFDVFTLGPLGPGRCIVFAAGNDRHLDLHAAFTVPRGTTQTVRVNLKTNSQRLLLFGSYNTPASLTCVVRAPGVPPAQQTAARPVATVTGVAVPVGTLAHTALVTREATDVTDPDAHFSIRVNDAVRLPTGVWEFDITAGAVVDGNVHLWIAAPSAHGAAILPFAGAVASAQDLTRDVKRPAEWISGSLCYDATTRSVVSVAAYDAEANPAALANFSGQGPAPSNLSQGLFDPASVIAKPDVAAPGMHIDAPRGEARKCCLECNCCVDRYIAEQGTSMAAPHIAGVVALMFARDPSLTPDEIKEILRNSSRAPPALPPGWPPAQELWGAGRVNAQAAVQASALRVIEPGAATAPEAVTAPQPVGVLPVGWPERLRAWADVLGKHPAWNLCAALVSQHFDEVKRLIDTNRRVAAVWRRHGGPGLVRSIAFADHPPDPPIPANIASAPSLELLVRLGKVLMRFGGDSLRSDIVRYAPLMSALPGASWSELDDIVGGHRP
jgi:subtilisin family serine protease